MPCCIPSPSPSSINDNNSYTKYDSVDDLLSLSDEMVPTAGFFKDKETINFLLDRAKGDEELNMAMIENAYLITNKNDIYMRNPYVTLIDKVNIVAIKSLNLLHKKISEGSEIHIKAGELLNKVIINHFIGTASDLKKDDINIDNWVNRNPLTKALKFCIKDNHGQPDINAVISERVIQYYQSIKNGASFLDCDPEVLTNRLLFNIFNFQTQIVPYANEKGFFSELTASGDKQIFNKRACIALPNYA